MFFFYTVMLMTNDNERVVGIFGMINWIIRIIVLVNKIYRNGH